MNNPTRDGFSWAVRGALAGGFVPVVLFTRKNDWLDPTSPVAWGGAVLLALCLLLIAELVRRRSDRWSHGLAGAGAALLLALGLMLVMTRPMPEAGYPVLLAAAAYTVLRLGGETGLAVMAAGAVAGSLLGGTDAGTSLLLCLVFLAFSREVPSRWQIASLIGLGVVCGVLDQTGQMLPGLALLPLVLAPWLLHFGAARPWRWTLLTAVLALLWCWPTEKEPRTAEVALLSAAGLLLLALPPAWRLKSEPDSPAARRVLEPLLAAAVVVVAWVLPLGLAPRWPWLGFLVMAPLLMWVGWRLSSAWLWLVAALSAFGVFFYTS